MHAWRALGNVLQSGQSWSGHERNCCFLNTHAQQFANVSAISGFDYPSDSRSIALVDWDQDGDLDLWTSNRTAPRVRYLQNNSEAVTKNSFVAFTLQGTKCNRDAIGARVELEAEIDGKSVKSIQTLRAGEGYLAQSSKWIHFGLGKSLPLYVHVRWPDGEEQAFADLKPNTRYRLVQGGDIEEVATSRKIQLQSRPAEVAKVDANVRIVPARRVPLPSLKLLDEALKPDAIRHDDNQVRLITAWATWCQPCLHELQALQKHKDALSMHDIHWLPINVDDFQSDDLPKRLSLAKDCLSKLGVTTPTALATPSAVACLDAVQRILTAREANLPLPCSFLIDHRGELAAVYKGPVDAARVISDVKEFEKQTADPRDHAVPISGFWSMNTFPPDLMAIPNKLSEMGRTLEAFEYLAKHVPTESFEPPITQETLGAAYSALGRDFLTKRQPANAESALKYALKVNLADVQSRLGLAEVLLVQKKWAEAVTQYREILQLADKQPMSLNNLAWILASCPDETVRSPKEAVAYAKTLCEMTKYEESVSLGTYAVALAADSQFDRAIETLDQAIAIARKQGKATDRMEMRRGLFKTHTPYIDD